MILRAALTVNEPLTCVMNSVCYKTHLCLHIPLELWLCWGQLPSALRWPEPSQAYKPLQPASPPSSCLLRAGISTCPQRGQPAGSTPWVQSSELTQEGLLPTFSRSLFLVPKARWGQLQQGAPFLLAAPFHFLATFIWGVQKTSWWFSETHCSRLPRGLFVGWFVVLLIK